MKKIFTIVALVLTLVLPSRKDDDDNGGGTLLKLMKKIFAIGALVITLVLPSCKDDDGDNGGNNNTDNTGTSLKLQNETFTDLIDITWGGVSFTSEAASLERGKNKTMPVNEGIGYIYFRGKSNSLVARTQELYTVEKGEQKTVVFLDTTLIVEKDNPNNTGQLKDLISRLSKPSTPTLSAASGSITAAWTAIAGAARYQVYCGIGSTPPAQPSREVTGTTAAITGLTNEQQYFVWVKAINALGESPLSDPADIIVRPPTLLKPSTPVLTTASGSITATWTAVEGAARYQVYCGIGSTPPADPRMGVSGTSTTITGLTGEQQYFVWVKALNGDSESPLSDPRDIIVRPVTTSLTWFGAWTRNSDTSYTSNTIGNNSSTWETLTITTTRECRVMVTLTASWSYSGTILVSDAGGALQRASITLPPRPPSGTPLVPGAVYNFGYATKLDGVQSASDYQIRVSETSSNRDIYTVPAGTHTIHFGYEKGNRPTGGNDNVTVEVSVQ